MSQILGRWIADGAIDHTKLDASDSYTLQRLHVTGNAQVDGIMSYPGGWRTVSSAVDRSSFPDAFRVEGMALYQIDDNVIWQLIDGTNNANWVAMITSGGTQGQTGVQGQTGLIGQTGLVGQTGVQGYTGLRGYSPYYALGRPTVINLSDADTDLTGFSGGFSDGRYSYFVPNTNYGKIARVDPYDSSVRILNLTSTHADLRKFRGGFTDGRYGYCVPNGSDTSGRACRIDLSDFTTVMSLNMPASDSELYGFWGGFTDGAYGYYVPDRSTSGHIGRIDLGNFSTATVLDLALTDSSLKGFRGGFTDGKYGYYVPYNNGAAFGKFVRVDLTNFAAAGIGILNLTDYNANLKGFSGGFTDGSCAYLVPHTLDGTAYHGYFTRINLTDFTSVSYLNLANTDASLVGFEGGFTDGRYGYLVPNKGGSGCKLARVDLYDFTTVSVLNLFPYMIASTDASAFLTLGQTSRYWMGMTAAPNGDVYACVYGPGDIYKQTGGIENFLALGQGSQNWRGMAAAPNGNVYACVYGPGNIYKQAGGVGDFLTLGLTARYWHGMAAVFNGDVYACVENGDIYKQTIGVGDFLPLGQTSRLWSSMAAAPNGDVYACVQFGSIYARLLGSTSFSGGFIDDKYAYFVPANNGKVARILLKYGGGHL